MNIQSISTLPISSPEPCSGDRRPSTDAHVLSGSAHGRILAQLAQSELRARLRRRRLFKSRLFSDPAWDILLDLFAAEYDGRRRFITSVALGAEIPQTTALRWIGLLEAECLLRRYPDPLDGRRHYLALTDDGLRTMAAYFNVRAAGAEADAEQGF